MSPKRKFDDSAAAATDPESATNSVPSDYFRVTVKPARGWGLPAVAGLAAVAVSAAIAASTVMLVRHEVDRRAAIDEAAALSHAREFMTDYLTLDPSDAAVYADRVLARSTGQFAMRFKQRQHEILDQVASSQPAVGTVLEAGVQRWNDDGSADVLLATKVATTVPDGTSTTESVSRWVATTVEEDGQWRIRNLVQVI